MVKKQMDLLPQEGECVIGNFLGQDVRKTFYEGEWWFSIIDIIATLGETPEPASYWGKMKNNDVELRREWTKLKLPSKDAKNRDTEVANVEEVLRIVQSIPSKNAEPFKKWLAKTGFERIQERQNPHLAIKRALLDYEVQGRSKKWIQTRIQGIITRNRLTEEWKNRGVKEGLEYANLTDAISEGTFGIKTKEHKEHKNLKRHQSLRDNMEEVELIFQMLGEQTTINITQQENPYGYKENYTTAKKGGGIAGEARKAYEKQIGQSVVSKNNFLDNKSNNGSLKLIQEEYTIEIENPNFEPAMDKIANTTKLKA